MKFTIFNHKIIKKFCLILKKILKNILFTLIYQNNAKYQFLSHTNRKEYTVTSLPNHFCVQYISINWNSCSCNCSYKCCRYCCSRNGSLSVLLPVSLVVLPLDRKVNYMQLLHADNNKNSICALEKKEKIRNKNNNTWVLIEYMQYLLFLFFMKKK